MVAATDAAMIIVSAAVTAAVSLLSFSSLSSAATDATIHVLLSAILATTAILAANVPTIGRRKEGAAPAAPSFFSLSFFLHLFSLFGILL